MTSTLVIENLIARVLFDPGATHSFIFVDLASKLGKPKKELTKVLLLSTLLGIVLPTDKMIENCEIRTRDVFTENDLVILDVNDFDIILGMD